MRHTGYMYPSRHLSIGLNVSHSAFLQLNVSALASIASSFADMNGTTRSVLCGNNWKLDTYDQASIRFEEDGSGSVSNTAGVLPHTLTYVKITCRCETVVWILTDIEWEPIDPKLLDQTINVNQSIR